MILDVWKSDFLLPSVDAKCLQFMLCARICAAPVQFMPNCAPYNSPDGDYPLFRCRNDEMIQHQQPETSTSRLVTDFGVYKTYLQKEVPKCAVDSHLTAEELEEMYAFQSMVEMNLRPAYLYTVWVDEYNFSCVTSRWYGSQLIFPYSLYYIQRRRSRCRTFVKEAAGGGDVTDKRIELLVMKKALYCLNLLSAKLGDKKYFFGNKPTSFDALIFGYLAPLIRLPLPSDQLRVHIKHCPNLGKFVDSLISIYLPLSEQEVTNQQTEMKKWLERRERAQSEIRHKATLDTPKSEQDSQEYPLRDKVFFGITAVVLSFIVAVHVGLINVELITSEESRPASSSHRESIESHDVNS